MAGTTSISSLQETLYYQYLINNNSTSTMLNALNGSSDEASGQSDGAVSMLRSIQSDSYLDGLSVVGLNLGEDASDLLGSLGGTSFFNVLESYLQTQQTTEQQASRPDIGEHRKRHGEHRKRHRQAPIQTAARA